MDTASTIHSRLTTYRPLMDAMDINIHSRHQWHDICPEDRETMVGIAMECLSRSELLDLFANSDLLIDVITETAHCLKNPNDGHRIHRAARDCALDVIEKQVIEAYEYVQWDYLSDDMAQHGKYPYNNRETGETEWRKHA